MTITPDFRNILRPKMAPGDFPACFAFSLHKSGSTLLTDLLKDVFVTSEIPFTNVSGVFFDEGVPLEKWEKSQEVANSLKRGFVHIGFRLFPEVLSDYDFSDAKSILLVRDPRDALVSRYFSFKPGGSHRPPSKDAEEWLKKRDRQIDVEIDAYVKKVSELVRNRIVAYHPLIASGLVKVYKYEEMFFDKEAFLISVLEHFGITASHALISDVAAKHDKRPIKEDQSKHIRKGLPGDHREKLSPDTIEWLNDYFREAMGPLGYNLT